MGRLRDFVFVYQMGEIMADDIRPFRESNDALDDPEEIRRRITDEGYLFIRGLQDKDKLLSLRRDVLSVMMDGGWLVQGTDVMDGIADISTRCTEGDIEYTDVHHLVYSLESFHRSGHWPEVMEMMEKVIGEEVLPHPQKILRLWYPQYTDHTTPIHQDYVHFQGSYNTYTCWAPIGDCPIELGPLAVIPGSHHVNAVHDHHFSLGAGALAIIEDELDGQWHSSDFEIGDSLIFHSLIVHQALPNVTEDRMRISLDNRYQAMDIPISEKNLVPHMSNLSSFDWDQVYANWETDDLKYYWKKYDLEVMERIDRWGLQGFEEALELARGGDPGAQHHLRRMIKRIPDTPEATRAREALA